MLNTVILMGRLTRDPELRTTPQGVSVVSFSLAVDRNYSKTEERQTDFINIIAWRSTADFVAKYFTKGQLVAVRGRLQTRQWQDQTGQKRYATDVVADEVFFAESKRDNAEYTASAVQTTTGMNLEVPTGFTVSNEDLPF